MTYSLWGDTHLLGLQNARKIDKTDNTLFITMQCPGLAQSSHFYRGLLRRIPPLSKRHNTGTLNKKKIKRSMCIKEKDLRILLI